MVPEILFAGVGMTPFGQPMRRTLRHSLAKSNRLSDRKRSIARGIDTLRRRPVGMMLKTDRCARYRSVVGRKI